MELSDSQCRTWGGTLYAPPPPPHSLLVMVTSCCRQTQPPAICPPGTPPGFLGSETGARAQ